MPGPATMCGAGLFLFVGSKLMRWSLPAVVLSAVLAGAIPASRAPQGPLVRVLSYNIHHGEGLDGRIDLNRLAGVVVDVRPDVVALQEVDRNVGRSGRVDQAAELARLTGLQMAFGRTVPLQDGEYGNAVLSRWPVREMSNRPLPSPAGGEARAVLAVEIAVPSEGPSETITVLATHFHHTGDPTNRIASAEAVERLFPADGPGEGRPMLLVGDLNATPESRPIGLLLESWSMAGAGQLAPTSPAPVPRRKIDYVMYRPRTRWRMIESRVIDEAVASDHRPVLAVLELLPAGGR
jgi:endonuclease/exonuclease/phosphatase family metal-dependent hydrolase